MLVDGGSGSGSKEVEYLSALMIGDWSKHWSWRVALIMWQSKTPRVWSEFQRRYVVVTGKNLLYPIHLER